MKKLSLIAIFSFISLITISTRSHAGDLEATVAGTVTKIDGINVDGGLTVRMRYFLKTKGSSFFLQSNFPGISPLLADGIVGYALRTTGTVFFELGAGFRYSLIFGPGLALMGGFGGNLTDRWYISLPVIYRWGFQFEATPYIGFRF